MVRPALLSTLLWLAGNAFADSPRDWLERMSHAHREVSYQGIVTHQVDDKLSSYKVIHQVLNGQEYELLKPLDAERPDLVRKGHSIHCVHPAERLLRGVETESALTRHYDLSVGETGRVAGRPVVVLKIVPRDVFRLGYQMALDAETAIPLRTETLDQRERVLERFQFMMFELGVSDVQASGAREVNHREVLPVRSREQVLASMNWNPGWVPPGFTLAEPGGKTGEALSYTDGISMFSIFMEAGEQRRSPSLTAMRSGATVSYTYPIPGRELVATVIGEIPLLTAEQVAKSLEISPQ